MSEKLIGKHFMSSGNISIFSYDHMPVDLMKRFEEVTAIIEDEDSIIVAETFKETVLMVYEDVLTPAHRAYLALDSINRNKIFKKDTRYHKRKSIQKRLMEYIFGCNINYYRRLNYDLEVAITSIMILDTADDNELFTKALTNNIDNWVVNDILYTVVSADTRKHIIKSLNTGCSVPVKYLSEVYTALEEERDKAVMRIYSHQ